MSEPSAWAYVDDKRTHELRVSIEQGRTTELVVRESASGSTDPLDRYTERHTLADPWNRKLQTLALETRLAALGNYYRSGATGWTPVRLAQAQEKVDLAPLALEGGSGTIEFHHFTGDDRHAVSLVGVHQGEGAARRSLLVRLDYQFPDTDGGNLQIIHTRLPSALYRSALASQHIELAQLRFRKALADQRHVVDPRTWAALCAALDGIIARLVETCKSTPDALRDPSGRPLDARSVILISHASHAAKDAASKDRSYVLDFEVDLPMRATEGKKPDVLIDEIPEDVFAALNEPRLVAIHQRYLSAQDQVDLFSRGERAIGLHMRYLREKVRPEERHLISLVEASVLLRYALAKRIPVDPDVIKRVQHARAYL